MRTSSPSWATAPGAPPSPCCWPRTPASRRPVERPRGERPHPARAARKCPPAARRADPAKHRLTTDVARAVAGADLLGPAIPTVYLRTTLQRDLRRSPPRPPVLSLAKGLEIRHVPAADGDRAEILGIDRHGGAERAESRRGGQPRPADLGRRRQPRPGAGAVGADAFQHRPLPRLYQSRPDRRRIGRGAEERHRHRRRYQRRPGFRRQRQGGAVDARPGRDDALRRRAGRGRRDLRWTGGFGRPDYDLRQPSRPQPRLSANASAAAKGRPTSWPDGAWWPRASTPPAASTSGRRDGHRHADHGRGLSRALRGQGSAARR